MGHAIVAGSSRRGKGSPRAVPHRRAFDLPRAAARILLVPLPAASTCRSNRPPAHRPRAGYPGPRGDSVAGRVRLHSVPALPAVDVAGRLRPTVIATLVARPVRLRA